MMRIEGGLGAEDRGWYEEGAGEGAYGDAAVPGGG